MTRIIVFLFSLLIVTPCFALCIAPTDGSPLNVDDCIGDVGNDPIIKGDSGEGITEALAVAAAANIGVELSSNKFYFIAAPIEISDSKSQVPLFFDGNGSTIKPMLKQWPDIVANWSTTNNSIIKLELDFDPNNQNPAQPRDGFVLRNLIIDADHISRYGLHIFGGENFSVERVEITGGAKAGIFIQSEGSLTISSPTEVLDVRNVLFRNVISHRNGIIRRNSANTQYVLDGVGIEIVGGSGNETGEFGNFATYPIENVNFIDCQANYNLAQGFRVQDANVALLGNQIEANDRTGVYVLSSDSTSLVATNLQQNNLQHAFVELIDDICLDLTPFAGVDPNKCGLGDNPYDCDCKDNVFIDPSNVDESVRFATAVTGSSIVGGIRTGVLFMNSIDTEIVPSP